MLQHFALTTGTYSKIFAIAVNCSICQNKKNENDLRYNEFRKIVTYIFDHNKAVITRWIHLKTLYLNKTGDNVCNNEINTVSNNLQFAADFAGLLILDNQPYEEIKHSERGYTGKIKFKRRNIQSTLARHQRIERNTAQANSYKTLKTS